MWWLTQYERELGIVEDERRRNLINDDVEVHHKLGGFRLAIVWIAVAVPVSYAIQSGLIYFARFGMKASPILRIWLISTLGVGATTGVISYFRRRQKLSMLRRTLKRYGYPVCLKCGYDMRGNEANRCPECGTLVNGSKKS